MAVEIADTLDRMGGNGTYPLIKSEDASYSNVNKTSVNNVKDALDELYNKESGVQLYIYESVAQACTYIPKSQRKLGRTILIGKNVGTEEEPEYINVQEFWWGNGIEDADLIVKTDLIILDDTNIIVPMADNDRFYLNIEIGQKFIWKGSYKYWDDGVPHSLVTNGIYICFYNEIMDYNDYKLIFCLTTPYISELATAGNIFPREVRYIGMNVNVAGEEYWFKDGIADEDLVVKSGSTSKIIHVVDDNDIEDFWFDYEDEEGKIWDDMASRIKNLKTGDLFMWNSPNSRFYYVHMYPNDMGCELIPYCVYKILGPEDYKTNKIKLIGDLRINEDGKDGVDGEDGVTPQLKIENGYWYVSYDNGTTWIELGKAVGENGEKGDKGDKGDQGIQGEKGADGEKGDKGDTAMVNLSVVDNKLVITNVELSQTNADDSRY